MAKKTLKKKPVVTKHTKSVTTTSAPIVYPAPAPLSEKIENYIIPSATTDNLLNYSIANNRFQVPVQIPYAKQVPYGQELSDDVLLRQIYAESAFNPKAVSSAGYKGLGQIGEDVIEEYKKATGAKNVDPFNINDNLAVQKWAMTNLYNADFINKPDQDPEIRLAKTLAGYNWGRGHLSDYLSEQKKKGVDIYNSKDWMNDLPTETKDYIEKILYKSNDQFNDEFKKAIENDKYKSIIGNFNYNPNQVVIDDNRGQWEYPGEVTRIASNDITMKGVPYPVLGVGADGEQRMMYPNEEHTFNQGPVTEYPMMQAKNGGWLSRYQPGGETFNYYTLPNGKKVRVENTNEGVSHYDPVTQTISFNPSDDPSNPEAVLQHEGLHAWQDEEGQMHIDTPNSYGPLKRPNMVQDGAFDEVLNYFNRRTLDEEYKTNQVLQRDPEFRFIPGDLLYNGHGAFPGVNELMYRDPRTVEGQARDYEYAFRRGEVKNPIIVNEYNRGGVTWLNEYAEGGKTFSSGGEKHKVYRKQSPTGNGKGVKGHIMVTHPTMDKGEWDTIDLTEKSGAKTVAEGIAATRKWHEENPEYQQGGPTTRYSYVLDDDSGNTVFDNNGNPIIINPTTNYTVREWLPQVNITATKLPKRGGIPTSNTSQSNGSLAADIALDAAQFVPGPLGVAASAVGIGKNLYEDDYVGAGLDLANIATAGGAKWLTLAADFAKAAGKANKGSRLAKQAKLLEHASNPNLWRTTGLTRDLLKVDKTGYTPTYKNEPKKAPNLISKKDGGWLNNYK